MSDELVEKLKLLRSNHRRFQPHDYEAMHEVVDDLLSILVGEDPYA